MKYQELSRLIGYQGSMDYPSKGYLSYLVHRLTVAPALEDFKIALKLYRFLPKPQNQDQYFMLQQLDCALTFAREKLFPNHSIVHTIIKCFNIRKIF